MYELDPDLTTWLSKYSKYVSQATFPEDDNKMLAFKLLFEASEELYLAVQLQGTSRAIKGVLTRCLIECYADVYAIFMHENPNKKAKQYVRYALSLDELFHQQAINYKRERDAGNGTIRPFELARKAQACWSGVDVTKRVENIDNNTNVIGFYEFFSLFAHVNPSRQTYLSHFDDPGIDKYYSHVMLSIISVFSRANLIPANLHDEIIEISSTYTEYHNQNFSSPERKNPRKD